MDPTIEYLWAAGYDLPPEAIQGGKPVISALDSAEAFGTFVPSAPAKQDKPGIVGRVLLVLKGKRGKKTK